MSTIHKPSGDVMIIDFAKKQVAVRPKKKALLSESLSALTDEQQVCYKQIVERVMTYKRVQESMGKFILSYNYKGRPLIKLFVKNNSLVCSFVWEDERFAQLRKDAAALSVPITERDVEIPVKKQSSLVLIYNALSLRKDQIDETIFLQETASDAKSAKPKKPYGAVVKEELYIPPHIIAVSPPKEKQSYIVVVNDGNGPRATEVNSAREVELILDTALASKESAAAKAEEMRSDQSKDITAKV
ncbi:MAG: hypothetical protein NC132_04980 [Corallococcus sp.]|nr:hypothetical protein [Corallococcus sp.]MCM1359742.1 hypothetical protein [Corallococcus sp.]MCM1395451.1 hypothetical protein [Corallococcus sp.]